MTTATLVVTLALAEGAVRFIMRPPQVYRMMIPGTQRVYNPAPGIVPGISGPARYEVSEDGVRGRAFGADSAEYRMLLVGGSTTESILLDQDETWGEVAAATLDTTSDGRDVWVGNVGRSGLTSRDHVVTTKFLLQEYPRIDMVIVLVGVNDLTVALRQGDDYQVPPPITDPQAEELQVRRAFVLAPGGYHQPMTNLLLAEDAPWYKSLALYQLVKRAMLARRARLLVQDVRGTNYSHWIANRQSASAMLDTLPDMSAALGEYRRSLDALVHVTRAHGAELVLMTQPALWKPDISPEEEARLWLGGTGNFQEEPGHVYYSAAALGRAMAAYNDVTLEVCRAENLLCIDLASQVPSDTTMMHDDVHFTEAGSALIGRILADSLRTTGPPALRNPRPMLRERNTP